MKKQNKTFIKESISSTVFHFCPLSTMYEISETNSFKLAKTGKYESDTRMNSLPTHIRGEKITYPYYMCFSRTPSTLVGYQLMRINQTKNEWLNSLVRMEIDGDALNSNYKGMPVNFFNEKSPSGDLAKKYKDAKNWDNFKAIPNKNGDKSDSILFGKGLLKTKSMPKINPDIHKRGRVSSSEIGRPKVDYQELERNRLSEYEDRIYSFNEYVPNANRYIRRIDILLSPRMLKQYNVLVMVNKIISKYGVDKVFVFDSQIAFNSMNIRNQVSKSKLRLNAYSDIGTNNVYDANKMTQDVNFELRNTDLDALSMIIAMTAFIPNFSRELFANRVEEICHILGLDRWGFYDKTIDYTNDILNYCINKLNKTFFDAIVGYSKTFPTYTQYVATYEKRNGGKKSLMNLMNSLINLAKKEAISFSMKYCGGENISPQVATKRKCLLYLKNKNNNTSAGLTN